MERLTKRNSEGAVILAKGCHDGCEYLTCHIEEGYQCNHQCEADCMCKLAKYEDAEENGMLIRLDSKDELIKILATKLCESEFGNCYMCKNPMKNITLDGKNNGCDGQCNTSEEFTVDDFLKKIVWEIEALKQMGE